VLAATLAFSALAPSAQSREPTQKAGKTAVTRTTNEDSERGFSAMVHVVRLEEAERFLREWKSTPNDHAPRLTFATTAVRGDIVSAMVLYAGCAADLPAGSECPARIDLRVIAPDGSTYGEYIDQSLAQGQPTATGLVQLSPNEMRIRFEPQDALGTYRVEVRIDDPDRDILLDLETSIDLVAEPPKP
jgi:hypothetical protein